MRAKIIDQRECPANKEPIDCAACEFGKEGLCDWPYAVGETQKELKNKSRKVLDVGSR